MSKKNIYLERYAWPEQYMNTASNADLIIVIPSYNEPNLQETLHSINQCTPPKGEVMIIVVVNDSEADNESVRALHRDTIEKLHHFDSPFDLKVIHVSLPEKKAGVGLARKVGMDEAVRCFETQQKDGVIICCDADCFVETNYLTAIEEFFTDQQYLVGLVHHEHRLDGEHQQEIIRYELFLRYYVNALRWSGFPYAFQTLGSCICVKSSAYQKQGGMNTRKAGEDFYFIHKMVPLKRIGEINQTTIYPSDRTSERVPFGTGHAINKQLQNEISQYMTYSPRTFHDLKKVFDQREEAYRHQSIDALKLPDSIKSFYQETDFEVAFQEILRQSSNYTNFYDRFFAWWDGFKVLKFVHYGRDHYYPNVPLSEAISWIDDAYLHLDIQQMSEKDQLLAIRKTDRSADFTISGTNP